MTDAEFLAAFENVTLSYAQWTHEAHVRMAFLYLRREDFENALPWVRERIGCYNRARGNPNGYNETITVAFLRVVADRLAQHEIAPDFETFKATHPELLDSRLLMRHYSKPVLLAEDAKARFVEPDREPLP